MLDTNTKLLLHCDYDGINPLNIIDSSPSKHIITPVGTAYIDTSTPKFESAAWYQGKLALDGDSDLASALDSPDWHFSTGDFTLHFRINFNSTSGPQIFMSQCENPALTNGWFLMLQPDGNLRIFFESGLYPNEIIQGYYYTTTPPTLTAGVDYHMAFERYGAGAFIFLDGVSLPLTEGVAFGTNDVGVQAAALGVGGYIPGGNYVNGHMWEIEVIKGEARWVDDFTPYCGLKPGKAYGHSPTPCFQMRHLGAGTV